MISTSAILDKILANRVLTHILYWIAIFVIAIIYGYAYGEPFELSLVLKKISLPAQILASYLFIYYQIPLLLKKKTLLFFFSFLASSYFFHIVMHLCNDLWFGKGIISYHPNHTFIEIIYSGEYYLRYAVDIYMVVFVTAGIKLIKDNLENKKEIEYLAAEKAKKEYQYLQSRMQPAFLLNTLQQIELQSKTDNQAAAQSIADLSEVLDYSLYKSDHTSISLIDEYYQMKLYSKLYLASSHTITSLQLSQSNILASQKIKPMSIVNTTERTLNYIDKLDSNNKSIQIEVTTIESVALLDIYIQGTQSQRINIEDLNHSILDSTSNIKMEIDVYPSDEECNIQIKINLHNE